MSLDLTSEPNYTTRTTEAASRTETQVRDSASLTDRKKYVGVRFQCCGIYQRIYVNKDGTAYEGRCPKCTKPVRLRIGEGGTTNRFFEAY